MTSRELTIAVYLLIAGLAVTLGVLSHIYPQRIATLAAVLRRTASRRSAYLGFVMAWWWLGKHFFIG